MGKSFKIRYKLPRKNILKQPKEIREVLENGVKGTGKTINLFYLAGQEEKFAVLVPRRVGNAVKRNRMKRIVREIYRRNKSWFKQSKAVFFVKRFNPNFEYLENEVGQLVNR